METIDLPPKAEALMESMRDVGYSIEAALADIVDNSISADARQIDVWFSPYDPAHIAIIDDGRGMESDELTQAMRPGSRSPREARDETDLGRFGLGLKTASFSQCRKLTVVSRVSGDPAGREWDLDYLNAVKEWKLKVVPASDIVALPTIEHLPPKGTLVLWRDLDRLKAVHSTSMESGMDAAMDRVQKHLELVFHRFLTGEAGLPKVTMRINGHALTAADPFGLQFPATQPLNREVVTVAGSEVIIQPFVLPHHSKISVTEYDRLGGEDGHLRNQGFYIYRNKRLIINGTWFRLVRQSELTKLARVQVDIPNTLDHLWTIDVKKSFAAPPEVVRRELRRVINQITGRSERVYTHKGQRTLLDGNVHVWERTQKHGKIRYVLNREHPLIQELVESLDDVDATELIDVMSMIESALPLEAIFADVGGKYKDVDQDQNEDAGVLERLVDAYIQLLRSSGVQEQDIKSRLFSVEPFCRKKVAVQKILSKWGITP